LGDDVIYSGTVSAAMEGRVEKTRWAQACGTISFRPLK
ncbi:5'/3'-nucleotidase SurE, partial [Stenotrophomonas sp. NPDC077659]